MTSEESFANLKAIRAEVYLHHDQDNAEWNANKNNPEKLREISHRYFAWRDDKEREKKRQSRLSFLVWACLAPCTTILTATQLQLLG